MFTMVTFAVKRRLLKITITRVSNSEVKMRNFDNFLSANNLRRNGPQWFAINISVYSIPYKNIAWYKNRTLVGTLVCSGVEILRE